MDGFGRGHAGPNTRTTYVAASRVGTSFVTDDPHLRLVKQQVKIAPNALDAARGSEAVVIATEWREFREIDWAAVYESMNKPAFVFDGRMILDADALRKIGFKVCFNL